MKANWNQHFPPAGCLRACGVISDGMCVNSSASQDDLHGILNIADRLGTTVELNASMLLTFQARLRVHSVIAT